jgi:sec-independent protein translocase protein TatB
MFDIGFSELMVIAVVALIVLGPERLPKVARTVGHLAGRLQRYVNDVKADISREIELDELRKFKNEFETAAQSVETDIRSEMHKAETSFTGLASEASLKPEIEKIDADIRSLLDGTRADPHSAAATPAGEGTPATEAPGGTSASPAPAESAPKSAAPG